MDRSRLLRPAGAWALVALFIGITGAPAPVAANPAGDAAWREADRARREFQRQQRVVECQNRVSAQQNNYRTPADFLRARQACSVMPRGL